ncbi:hypothetical protein [Burkholderia ubonensis]|uniref:Ribbon-helix-helix protein CopG domain-containing protein n=1 Tax=Burkholderia ubonensis TaxID=101571 RepID=A0A108CIR7_9BURK|nr:hypothetical protein [Burkholderia ubonensis]KVC82451.1 hypothetical protein WI76_09025 [Burkholderia ubonensis]KVS40950.1 hypothetical protein WK37_20545 [Burkholderia ubonensis]KVS53110.1 hypothetical protein WK38_09460 [Burkholderia ubonensis]KVS71304.1 hypothetical protein WK42_24910 [Burkholderia ubonensis]KVS83378.1 hypothetical protein WK43_24905 [Burkholderia ubonensis]
MTTAKGPRRSPRGTMSDKPVYVGLTPTERDELEQLAAQRNRSISSMARELIRMGVLQLRFIPAPRSRASRR